MTREQMMRLADFFVEDIMAMTDQEILLEETETAAEFAAIVVDNPSYQLSPEFHGDRLALAKGFVSLRAQLKADGETIARLTAERDAARFECGTSEEAVGLMRYELQQEPSIPCPAFADDHARNAVIRVRQEMARATKAEGERDAALARVAEVERIFDLRWKASMRRVVSKDADEQCLARVAELEAAGDDDRTLTIIARSIGRTMRTSNHTERARDIVRSLRSENLTLPTPSRAREALKGTPP